MEKITEAHGGGAVRGHWTDIDPLSANKGETRRSKMLRVGRGREMHDGTRRRNEDERSAPLFGGGQAKRGSRAGSGGDGEGDEAALHGGIQAVGHQEGGAMRGAG